MNVSTNLNELLIAVSLSLALLSAQAGRLAFAHRQVISLYAGQVQKLNAELDGSSE
jgi:hypothetical protein